MFQNIRHIYFTFTYRAECFHSFLFIWFDLVWFDFVLCWNVKRVLLFNLKRFSMNGANYFGRCLPHHKNTSHILYMYFIRVWHFFFLFRYGTQPFTYCPNGFWHATFEWNLSFRMGGNMLMIGPILVENYDQNLIKIDFARNRSNISHKMDHSGSVRIGQHFASVATSAFIFSIHLFWASNGYYPSRFWRTDVGYNFAVYRIRWICIRFGDSVYWKCAKSDRAKKRTTLIHTN